MVFNSTDRLRQGRENEKEFLRNDKAISAKIEAAIREKIAGGNVSIVTSPEEMEIEEVE